MSIPKINLQFNFIPMKIKWLHFTIFNRENLINKYNQSYIYFKQVIRHLKAK